MTATNTKPPKALVAEATANHPPKTGSSHRPMSDSAALTTSDTVEQESDRQDHAE